MGSFGQVLDTLERELQGVSDTFASLSDDEWRMDTLLEPFEPVARAGRSSSSPDTWTSRSGSPAC